MEVDRYTKLCLTVIALSLAIIAVRGLSPATQAQAASDIQRIAICDTGGMCADVDAYGALVMKQSD